MVDSLSDENGQLPASLATILKFRTPKKIDRETIQDQKYYAFEMCQPHSLVKVHLGNMRKADAARQVMFEIQQKAIEEGRWPANLDRTIVNSGRYAGRFKRDRKPAPDVSDTTEANRLRSQRRRANSKNTNKVDDIEDPTEAMDGGDPDEEDDEQYNEEDASEKPNYTVIKDGRGSGTSVGHNIGYTRDATALRLDVKTLEKYALDEICPGHHVSGNLASRKPAKRTPAKKTSKATPSKGSPKSGIKRNINKVPGDAPDTPTKRPSTSKKTA